MFFCKRQIRRRYLYPIIPIINDFYLFTSTLYLKSMFQIYILSLTRRYYTQFHCFVFLRTRKSFESKKIISDLIIRNYLLTRTIPQEWHAQRITIIRRIYITHQNVHTERKYNVIIPSCCSLSAVIFNKLPFALGTIRRWSGLQGRNGVTLSIIRSPQGRGKHERL